MATITCQDCGVKRERVPSNTRYCKACRLLRDLDHWRRERRTCSCGKKFAPLGRADYYCSACNAGLRAHAGPCVLALKDKPHEGWPVYSQIPVCAKCMRDPAMRQRLINALTHGQASRRSANPKETP